MKRSQPKRDWAGANAKVERESGCRVCGDPNVQRAHVSGRTYDEPRAWNGQASKTLYVKPASIVGLCERHHALYDAHKFDLLPYLTREEEVQAVKDLGLENARIRLCPSEYKRSAA